MPEIQEYNTEISAPGPQGSISPNLEAIGQAGQGMERAGRDLEDVGTSLHHAIASREASDAFYNAMDLRQKGAAQIQEDMDKQNIDADYTGKLAEKLNSWQADQAGQYDTNAGKNAFMRASSRTIGLLMQHAGTAQAQVLGQQASDKLLGYSNGNAATVMADPSQYTDMRVANREYLQSQIDTGVLNPKMAKDMSEKMDTDLFYAAFQGKANLDSAALKSEIIAQGDPDKVNYDDPKFNSAREWLNSGNGDQIMSPEKRQQLENSIRTSQAAGILGAKQQINMKAQQIGVDQEKWKIDANIKLSKGQLTADDVNKAATLIGSKGQEHFLHLVDEQASPWEMTDPKTKNDIMSRILLPDGDPNKIYSSHDPDIMSKVGQGLSTKDYLGIDKYIRAQPENKMYEAGEKSLMKLAGDWIKKDDPYRDYKLMQYQQEINNAKENAANNKEPLKNLFDPSSKDYLGKEIGKYVLSAQEGMKVRAQMRAGTFQLPDPIMTVKPGVDPQQAIREAQAVQANRAAIGLPPITNSEANIPTPTANWGVNVQGEPKAGAKDNGDELSNWISQAVNKALNNEPLSPNVKQPEMSPEKLVPSWFKSDSSWNNNVPSSQASQAVAQLATQAAHQAVQQTVPDEAGPAVKMAAAKTAAQTAIQVAQMIQAQLNLPAAGQLNSDSPSVESSDDKKKNKQNAMEGEGAAYINKASSMSSKFTNVLQKVMGITPASAALSISENTSIPDSMKNMMLSATGVGHGGSYTSAPASRWKSIYDRAANNYGIPADLLSAVSMHESGGGNPSARNPKSGATGLMQLLPSTAEKDFGVDRKKLTEPQLNVDIGAQYLKNMYNRFGSWEAALVAYNRGPGILDRKIKQFGSYEAYKNAPASAGGLAENYENSHYVQKIEKILGRKVDG